MFRNVGSKKIPRHGEVKQRRSRVAHPGPGRNNRRKWSISTGTCVLLCAVVMSVYYLGLVLSPGAETGVPSAGSGGGGDRANRAGGRGTGKGAAGVTSEREEFNISHVRARHGNPADRAMWKRAAGWETVADQDLEHWAPLGPDPPGYLERTPATAAGPLVMIGWGFGSTRLTLYGYRALESVLHVYPKARVRFITIGPKYAVSYKWSNILALPQFQKYEKRGYDVQVELYNGKAAHRTKDKGRSLPGHVWWERHKATKLFGRPMEFSTFQAVQDALPSAETTLFLALLELYKTGGIYVDLTTFFVRPLPRDLNGFVAGGEYAGAAGPSVAAGSGTRNRGEGFGTSRGDCSLQSTDKRQRAFVMQYSKPRHPVVACVLEAYDDGNSVLNICAERPDSREYGALDCVLTALESCTAQMGHQNDLREAEVVEWHSCNEDTTRSHSLSSWLPHQPDYAAATWETITAIPPRHSPVSGFGGAPITNNTAYGIPKESSGSSTSSRIIRNGDSAVIDTVLLPSSTKIWQVEEARREEGKGRMGLRRWLLPASGSSVWGALGRGGLSHAAVNRRRVSAEVEIRVSGDGDVNVDVEDVGGLGGGGVASDGARGGVDWRASSEVLAPVDEEPAEGSAGNAGNRDRGSSIAKIYAGGKRSRRVSLVWLGPEVSDGEWKAPEDGSVWEEAFSRLRLTKWKPQHVSAACRTPCGHWNTNSSMGSEPPPLAVDQTHFQCAPSVFVPGTQKGASTFLFHAISSHPQVVQPLRGAHGFKETGRYLPTVAAGGSKLGIRLAAFPFLEEHENIMVGDGTVTYMFQSKNVPAYIAADNPHTKIVFALRDPVARAWSDYRFMWNIYSVPRQPGFPQLVKDSIPKLAKCFLGHEVLDPEPLDIVGGAAGQLTPSAQDAEGISIFYSHCTVTKDTGQLVRKGLYYYQVLHWATIFGVDNIMVVDSADLKSRQKETLEEVYNFLGLCPADVSGMLKPENVTPSPKIPREKAMDEESFKELQDFFAPFNRKLYKLLGRDLGWEKNVF